MNQKGPTILVIGASNAGRTADALEKAGEHVSRAVIPGWRCMKPKIPAMVDLVRSKLEEAKGDIVVILQLFDNCFFLAQTEDGGLLPAVREPVGGKFHVHGDLVFAPKELQYSLFNMVMPILDLVNHHLKIIVSPIPRYLRARCCLDTDHVSNLEEDSYQNNQEEAIHTCRKHLKDFAFRQGVRNLRVISPWSKLKLLEGNLWPTDPVHMEERGYTAIADMLIDTVQQCAGMDLGIGGGGYSGGGGGGSSSHCHSGTHCGGSNSHGAERWTRRSTAPVSGSGRSSGASWQPSHLGTGSIGMTGMTVVLLPAETEMLLMVLTSSSA